MWPPGERPENHGGGPMNAEATIDDWPYSPVLFSRVHPEKGCDYKAPDDEPVDDGARETEWLTTADLVRLLAVDDEILVSGRKQPLRVFKRYQHKEGQKNSGCTGIYWAVEGPGGGDYRVTNWWHWGDGGDGWADCTGLWPQMRNRDSGDLVTHLYRFAVDAPIHSGQPDGDAFDAVTRVLHTTPIRDGTYYGEVVDTEFGEFVVRPDGPAEKRLTEGSYTVDPTDVFGYRTEGTP